MKQKRSNTEWLDELRGPHGSEVQRQAHMDLAKFIFTVAYNYLLDRQYANSAPAIQHYMSEDLAALAEDHTQDILIKLGADNCARLDKYNGTGSFTGWIAVITRNHISSSLRLLAYKYPNDNIDEIINLPLVGLDSDAQVAIREVLEELIDCINRLIERRRHTFIRCCIENAPAAVVANELGCSEQAVYLLVMHAKRNLRDCMIAKGFGPDVLNLFEA